MAELINKKAGDSLWLLNERSNYPGVTDLHIHQYSQGGVTGLTLTMTYKGHKEHLELDVYATVSDFRSTANYMYRKMTQKYGD